MKWDNHPQSLWRWAQGGTRPINPQLLFLASIPNKKPNSFISVGLGTFSFWPSKDRILLLVYSF
ncbi:MAG: hypothetical protein A3I11_01815 [Elusimicrobia bacterium RIFCSPLOWO2_02_FULL_39_32]|nr:MAG: hypothetical protein A2034_04615 [Elusimicrobia bacterium GWA2_38_7]OGR78274.1 MAG: hypothetical protein A3B80_06305 [Elusimicrobia bacterium RIFCSPHIGHO2_02_FULL_39_36]OGR92411.1 MAG: hypothetical protein A3I11_01815 [Elusimicrobia bacterium RIFCSPLOWO2_02_FULL_39_32]OGR98954.1 MAG: hypothetical protein A3G85_04120 [Elusimicrobia bacterium RIFCSPLOWO2_12_FULL_39_28]